MHPATHPEIHTTNQPPTQPTHVNPQVSPTRIDMDQFLTALARENTRMQSKESENMTRHRK